ncbi:hypothetical protein [Arthrobacter sp. AD-310]
MVDSGSLAPRLRCFKRALVVPAAALGLLLVSCAPQGGSAPPAGGSGVRQGEESPACELITYDIAATVLPGLTPVGQQSAQRPPGTKAYLCSYSNKSMEGGMVALSVALTSPASDGDKARARSMPDCTPVQGIGDFACLQWTGYFQGEAGGASANVVLHAVRGDEVLEMPYVVSGPMNGGSTPDGGAMAGAVAQAAVDAGWGNGEELVVPAAPPVGPLSATK